MRPREFVVGLLLWWRESIRTQEREAARENKNKREGKREEQEVLKMPASSLDHLPSSI